MPNLVPYSKVGRRRRGENPNPAQQQPIMQATKKFIFSAATYGRRRASSQSKKDETDIDFPDYNEPLAQKKSFEGGLVDL